MDDLLDLDWSSASSAQQNKTNGSQQPKGKTSFDYLSNQISSGGSAAPLRPTSPAALPRPRQPPQSQPATSNSSDAFSSLFGPTPSSQAASQCSLPMAQRLGSQSSAPSGSGSALFTHLARTSSPGPSPTSGSPAFGRSGSPALPTQSRIPSSSSSPYLALPQPINSNAPQRNSSDPWDFDLLSSAPSSSKSTAKSSVASSPARSRSPAPPKTQVRKPQTTALVDLGFDDSGDFTQEQATTSADPIAAVEPSRDSLDDFLSGASSENKGADDGGQDEGPLQKGGIFLDEEDEDGFDGFGEGGESMLGGQDDEDGGDEVFGVPSRSAAKKTNVSSSSSRSPSPPPHVLGELVMMGFSVQQAKTALAATFNPEVGEGRDKGWNLQGAAEMLLEDSEAQNQNGRRGESNGGRGNPRSDERRRPPQQRQEQDRLRPSARGEGRQGGMGFQERSHRQLDRTLDDPRDTSKQSTPGPSANELLAQASGFGLNVLSTASSYWQTGRKHLQKMVDERVGGADALAGSRKKGDKEQSSGRPKWMTESPEVDDERAARDFAVSSSFRDEDEGGEEMQGPTGNPSTATTNRPQGVRPRPAGTTRPGRDVPPSAGPPSTLPEPQVYSSSARWRVPQRDGATTPQPSSAPAQPRPRIDTEPPPPPPLPTRTHAVPSAVQLTKSTAARTKGNELFKLGRYGESESAYSLAIAALPQGCLAAVPLRNNRALSRLKSGDGKGTIEDCDQVVIIILGPYGFTTDGSSSSITCPGSQSLSPYIDLGRLQRESDAFVSVSAGSAGAAAAAKDLNLVDQLSKALSRRAKAYETMEKWKAALDDWSVILGGGEPFVRSAGGLKVVSESLTRCRRAVNGDSDKVEVKKRRPKPPARPPPKPTAQDKPSESVVRLQASNAAVEAEEALRLSLKDAIDSRVLSWKSGKETNLRALIASLDNVLWPELGWKKVGMGELLTDGQLKVKYVRAIAKVHPDKLAPGTTVEQRMIANAVFGGLNEAWNARQA